MNNLLQICLSIPRNIPEAVRFAFVNSYALRTGDNSGELLKTLRAQASGLEIVYTTPQGDRHEVY